MERDEIIRLAREAGFAMNLIGHLVVPAPKYDATKYLKRFAALCFAAGQRDMKARAIQSCMDAENTNKAFGADGYAEECAREIEQLEIKEP